MMYVWILLCVFLVGTGEGRTPTWDELAGASPGERIEEQIAPILREIAITLEQRISEGVLLDTVSQQKFHEYMLEAQEDMSNPEKYLDCVGCRAYIGGILGLISHGLGFEQVRPMSIEVCNQVCDGNNWRGDIICDGMIDNYGPHVMWILNTTDLTANEICGKYRLCRETFEDEKPEISIDFFPPIEKKEETKVAKKKRNLDDMIKVVQLTDIHVDELYAEGSATDCNLPICCRDYWNGTGSAGPWGQQGCQLPPRVVHLLLDYMMEMEPDYALYSGDNAPSSMWEETFDSQIQTGTFVSSALRDHLPGVPVFPTIGNHDMYPTNQYYAPMNYTQFFNHEYYNQWADLGDLGEEQKKTIMTAGYFQKLLQPGLRLLSYNSNYGYNDNYYGILNEDEESFLKMLDFMEDTFNMARKNGEKILLLSHHAIGSKGYFKYYETPIDDIVSRNGDLIIIQPQGHTHNNQFKLTLDENGEPKAVWMITAAVVGQLSTATARMFYLDPDTFQAVDYETYQLDLEEALAEGKADPQLKLVYRASDEYGVDDLSAQSMFELTQRFETDDELWHQYRYNQVSRRSVPGPCLGSCRDNALCSMRSTTYSKYQACVAQAEQRNNK